jgi:hypothetical protein
VNVGVHASSTIAPSQTVSVSTPLVAAPVEFGTPVAPRRATVVPRTSRTAGAKGCSSSTPMPTTGSGADATAASVSASPFGAIVDGMVVRHGDDVDSRGGQRLEGDRSDPEGVRLGLGYPTVGNRSLKIDDGDVSGG